MSEFAPEWPVEADAIAGNMDHLDVDAEPDYGYDDEGDLLPWEQEAAIDPQSPEFQEAAREFAREHVQSTIEYLIQENLAPLGAQMEAALEKERQADGWDVAADVLEEAGLEEAVWEQAVETAEQFVDWHAQQMGVDAKQWLELLAESRGIDVGDAAKLVLQAVSDAHHHNERFKPGSGERAVVAKYFGDPTPAPARNPTDEAAPGARNPERAVVTKYFGGGG
jgi:hypothetical protein